MSSGRDLGPHLPLLTKLYQDEGWSLSAVQAKMREDFGIYVSDKVYKDNFKSCNLRRNLSKEEVVAILHINKWAELKGKKCSIRIRGKPLRQIRVKNYLRKSRTDKDTLLSRNHLSEGQIPSYIKYDLEVGSSPSVAPISTPSTLLTPGGQTDLTSLTPNSSFRLPQAATSVSTSERQRTPKSSLSASFRQYNGTSQSRSEDRGLRYDISLPMEERDSGSLLPQMHHPAYFRGSGEPQPSLPQVPTEYMNWLVGNMDATSLPTNWAVTDISRQLSISPPVMEDRQHQTESAFLSNTGSPLPPVFLSHDPKELEHQSQIWVNKIQGVEFQTQPGHLQPRGDPQHFLSQSIYACLCRNAGDNDEMEEALQEAAEGFKVMIVNRHDLSITSLNFILALLDAHGRDDVKHDLLAATQVACASLAEVPVKMAVLVLIQHKLDVMEKRPANQASDHNALREVYFSFLEHWGPDDPSTLACLCNISWRLAGDDDTGRLQEAEIRLSGAQTKLEDRLGADDPQTIMCLAVLARALYNLDKPLEGLEKMEIAVERMRRRYTHCHPIYLSALHRLSIFKRKVNLGDPGALLWEVAAKRLRMLGPDCALTRNSEKELVEFLVKIGKKTEAHEAHEFIAMKAAEIDPGNDVELLFWAKLSVPG